MDVTEIIWRPDPEAAARTRMGRFMTQHGLATLEDLQRRSIAEPEWYWDAVSRDLDFHWFTPYRRVLDESQGIAWPRWFEGGRLNLADNCVDRHIAAGRGGKPAVIAEAEDGTVRTLTYVELGAEVGRLANALKRLGTGWSIFVEAQRLETNTYPDSVWPSEASRSFCASSLSRRLFSSLISAPARSPARCTRVRSTLRPTTCRISPASKGLLM